MDTQREKLIAKKQKIVAGFIILGLITTVLFLRYKGEKLLDIARPDQQVTYYKVLELKQQDHTALSQTIKVYSGQCRARRVQHPKSPCNYNEEDIKVYE